MNDWDDAERRIEKAQELFEQHRWSEALEELRAAININPYNGSGSSTSASHWTKWAVSTRRSRPIGRHWRSTRTTCSRCNHLGVDLHRVGNFDEALKTFARIESIDPAFEPCYCHRIITYSELGDHEKAEEMFYLARLYKEHCPHCYYNIGCSLYDRGLYEKAIYCWQKTLDLDERHPEVQVRIAEAYWGKGELEAARQHYLIGLRQDPGNTETLLDLGDLLMEMGRNEEAGEKFRRAIELAPEEPGRLLLPRPMADAAVRSATMSRRSSLSPRSCSSIRPIRRPICDWASCTTAAASAPCARRHLRAELVLRPQDPQVLLDLSNLLLDTGQCRAAVACLKRLAADRAEECRCTGKIWPWPSSRWGGTGGNRQLPARR